MRNARTAGEPKCKQQQKRILIALGAAFAATAAAAWVATGTPNDPPPKPTTTNAAAPGAAQQATDISRHGGNRDDANERIAVVATPATTGQEWFAHGIVLDDDERAIEQAPVRLWLLIGEHEGATRRDLGEVRTDANGRFRLSIDSMRAMSPAAREQSNIQAKCDLDGMIPVEQYIYLRTVLAGGSSGLFQLNPSKERLIKGRVVTPTGLAIQGAMISFLFEHEADCESEEDGTFYYEPTDQEVGHAVVFASHNKHGRSRALRLTVDPGKELRIPDLVIANPGNRVRGRVLMPDQQPATDIDVTCSLADLASRHSLKVDGITLTATEYESVFLDQGLSTETDQDGSFQFCNLPLGRHTLSVGHDIEIPIIIDGRNCDRNIDVTLSKDQLDAQILVRIEDEQGVRLSAARYNIHHWLGEHASAAQQQFLRAGATSELLRTADEHDTEQNGNDTTVWTSPNSFSVFEACYHGRGPAYASCRLLPEQYRGSVTMVLAPPDPSRSVRIHIQRPDATTGGPAWVRMSQAPFHIRTPLSIPGSERWGGPNTEIRGAWYELPNNGQLRGLPSGDLMIEVLPYSMVGERRVFDFTWAKAQTFVPTTGIADVSVQAQRGAHLAVRLEAPVVAGERAVLEYTKLYITPASGGRRRVVRLTKVGSGCGGSWQAATQSRRVERSDFSFAEGTYTLVCTSRIQAKVWREALKKRPAGWSTGNWSSAATVKTVHLRRGQPPITLEMELPAKIKAKLR